MSEGITVYQMANLARSDNGTILQCFINGESSNIITLIVDCKYVRIIIIKVYSINLSVIE